MFDRYPIIVLLQTNVARSSEADLLQLEICVPELTRSIFSIGLFVKSLVGLESKTQFIAYFNNEVPNRIKLKNGPVFLEGTGCWGGQFPIKNLAQQRLLQKLIVHGTSWEQN